MKKIISFVVFAALTSVSYSQSLDYQNIAIMFSNNDENGSARFVSMGGAFGALGGDVSSMLINPAGISVFNGNNAAIAFQTRHTDIATNYYGNSLTTQEDFFNISNAGAVFTFENNIDNEWSKFAFGVNFRVTTDFENRFNANGNSGFSTFDSFPLDESQNPILYNVSENQEFSNFYNGELAELNFVFSGLYEEKLHVGAGLNFYDINFSQQTLLMENNNDGNENSLTSKFYQENYTNGVGFSLSAGFIYKPTNAIRLGLSYQSPTWFTELIENTNIINNDGFFGDTEIQVSNDDVIYDNTFGGNLPIQELLYKLRAPAKITASTAFIFGKIGLISLDYSSKNYTNLYLSGDNFTQENLFFDNQLQNASSIHLGTEWRINQLSLRGGYQYLESPYKNLIFSDDQETYSFGLGYNFGSIKLNLAYRKSNKREQYNFYPQYNQIEAAQLAIDNTVATIGLSVNI